MLARRIDVDERLSRTFGHAIHSCVGFTNGQTSWCRCVCVWVAESGLWLSPLSTTLAVLAGHAPAPQLLHPREAAVHCAIPFVRYEIRSRFAQ